MRILELPEDRDAQRIWLEGKLLEPDIVSLVREFQAVANLRSQRDPLSKGDSVDKTRTLEEAFAGEQSIWVDEGFRSMSDDAWRMLVQNPELILRLQEQIYIRNSAYWKQKIESVTRENEMAVTRSGPGDRESRSRVRRLLLVLAATVCMVAVGTPLLSIRNKQVIRDEQVVASSGWGWSESPSQQTFSTPDEYLAWVSQGANAWFNKELSSASDFSQRLDELREGCQRLIDAEHTALPLETRQFLVARCKEWKAKFDTTAMQIRQSPEKFVELKQHTDQSIRNLIAVLDQIRQEV